MKKMIKKFIVFAAPYLAYFIIKSLKMTMRIDVLNAGQVQKVHDDKKNIIMAFWHGRLLMMPEAYRGQGISILISMHEDGEIISRAMKLFGFSSVRGSTTRGSTKALREMVRTLKGGTDICITPDGPKGPRYTAQNGAIIVAKMTGVPIFPVAFNASKGKRFSSWDGFLLPRPFSKGVFIWGNPVSVSRDADKEEIEKKRVELEVEMRRITELADAHFLSDKCS